MTSAYFLLYPPAKWSVNPASNKIYSGDSKWITKVALLWMWRRNPLTTWPTTCTRGSACTQGGLRDVTRATPDATDLTDYQPKMHWPVAFQKNTVRKTERERARDEGTRMPRCVCDQASGRCQSVPRAPSAHRSSFALETNALAFINKKKGGLRLSKSQPNGTLTETRRVLALALWRRCLVWHGKIRFAAILVCGWRLETIVWDLRHLVWRWSWETLDVSVSLTSGRTRPPLFNFWHELSLLTIYSNTLHCKTLSGRYKSLFTTSLPGCAQHFW